MYTLLLLGLSSFLLSFLLTPFVRDLFARFGLLDRPDGTRKIHDSPVPRTGGAPILAAYAGAFAVLALSPPEAGAVQEALALVWKLAPAVALVFLTGALDDVRGLTPWQKLTGQIAAAALVCVQGGIHVHGGAWWSVPLTVLWLAACANAFNLIDGVDGLAAGIALLAAAATLIAAFLRGDFRLVLATVPLAGALLGFLRFNFSPASIFLGDSGSLTIGFLLGCFGVLWSNASTAPLGMTAPVMVLAVPLLDTSLAIVRRLARKQPVFRPDRGHIHHRLIARGLSHRRVVLLLYAASGLAAGFSLLQNAVYRDYGGPVMVLFCAAASAGVAQLGYRETGAVAGRIPGNSLAVKRIAAPGRPARQALEQV